MALPEVKPLFGLGYVETVLKLMDRWLGITGDREAIVFRGAYASLVSYREHAGTALAQERPDLLRRITKFLIDHKPNDEHLSLGGTLTITTQGFQKADERVNFERLENQPRNVRVFVDCHIPDSAIRQDMVLRRTCKIPHWEIPIMMIVVGYPPDNVEVAASAQRLVESVLSFRDLAVEASNR